MKTSYTQQQFVTLLAEVKRRNGWDFSRMKTSRQPVPWIYDEVTRHYLNNTDKVLDIGTGGGENFVRLSRFFDSGLGVDIDPEMISVAIKKTKVKNVTFRVADEMLLSMNDTFNVVLNRHAPYDLLAVKRCLKHGGYFITQQVGERNMQNVRSVLNQLPTKPVIRKEYASEAKLKLIAFMEYDVEYVVCDIESLVFWLNALDILHAGMEGTNALDNVDIFNRILKGNVDDHGFITNEHRYLLIAQQP